MQSHGIVMPEKKGATYYNDIDPYCCHVLRKNIHLGFLPEGHVDERDIREVRAADLMGYQHIHLFAGIGGFPLGLKWADFPSSVRLLTGGFPCQDISIAGKQAGITGERSGLWREMYRLICDIRPDFVIVENVAALLHGGIDSVLRDLAACGYDAEWQVLSAAQFGAPHLRRRVFIIAYPQCIASQQRYQVEMQRRWTQETEQIGMGSSSIPYPISTGLPGRWQQRGISETAPEWTPAIFERRNSTRPQRSTWWQSEPSVGRVVTRLPHRVDRLRGLGNAVVPQVVEYIARSIMASLEGRSEVAV